MTTTTMPEEAAMALATLFATSDLSDPSQDIHTLRRALSLMHTYVEEHNSVTAAMSWVSAMGLAACQLAALSIKLCADVSDESVDTWVQRIANALYVTITEDEAEGESK